MLLCSMSHSEKLIFLYIARILSRFYFLLRLICIISFSSIAELIFNLERTEKGNVLNYIIVILLQETHLYLHFVFIRTQRSIRSRHG